MHGSFSHGRLSIVFVLQGVRKMVVTSLHKVGRRVRRWFLVYLLGEVCRLWSTIVFYRLIRLLQILA